MIKNIISTIKRVLSLKVEFDNILGSQKYRKNTNIQKENICILGISKL